MYTIQRRTLFYILCVVFVLCFVSLSVYANESSYPKRVSIAAASPGGGYYMAASALAKVISKMPNVDCVVEVTQASKHNMKLIQAGISDIGLTVSRYAWEGWNGKGAFEGKKTDKLRTLFHHYSTRYIFVTLERTGIEDIKDFDGKRYSGGPGINSALAASSNYVFELLGIHPKMVYLPSMDAGRSLVDGTISGFTGSAPETVVHQLEITQKVRILTLSKEELDSFFKKYPQFQRTLITNEMYKSVKQDMETFGNYAMFIANKDLSEDFVYDLCKAAFDNIEAIELISPAMAKGMNAKVVKYTPIPYHPGAIKYFRERGAIFPPSLIPPEMK